MNESSGTRLLEGRERIRRVQQALKDAQLDAVFATLPSYVLMLSGYWPVIGTAMAIVTAEGEVGVLAPEDELRFAEHSWAHHIRTFKPASLVEITTAAISAGASLKQLLRDLKVHCAHIGYEMGAFSEPSTYAGMNLYAHTVIDILRDAAPSAPLAPADELVRRLATVKTPEEVARIRLACEIAGLSFDNGRNQIRDGAMETGVAVLYRSGFSIYGMLSEAIKRADGFAWCMSGPNSALAKGAFAHSTSRKMQPGDFVLVHANSYTDGYWTDITRTQVLGEPDDRQRKMFGAIAKAREAAFAAIEPGARACDVDRAAREILKQHGFDFPHSAGHGVGFNAISANARPRIHPASNELLEAGMTFNIEPAVYIEGYGGARHCDMVAVTETGMELLTDFQPIES